jgi:hypothetical protein
VTFNRARARRPKARFDLTGLESRQMLKASETLMIDDKLYHATSCGCGGCRVLIPVDIASIIMDSSGVSESESTENDDRFNITLSLTGMTTAQQAIFQSAAAKWESIILGDLPEINGIDDIRISGSLVPIDGPGSVLGQATYTGLRPSSGVGALTPYQGFMQFDSADVGSWSTSFFEGVVLHEMAHVLGIGTIWSLKGLVSGIGGSNPRYNGAAALDEYRKLRTPGETSIPVENAGGPGTAGGHWRESDISTELMTGFANSVMQLSRITAGSFIDMGYIDVNLDAADVFNAPGGNVVPAVSGLIDSPDPSNGPTVTLTATGVSDPTAVSSVGFWRESNGIPGLQSQTSNPDVLLGTLTAPVNGAWTIDTDVSMLATGSYTFYTRALDSQGAASAIRSTVHNRVVDGLPPAVPSTPQLASFSDSGISSSDGITNVTLPTFTGTGEAGSTVIVRVDDIDAGQSLVQPDGSWSVTLTTALTGGSYSITAVAQGLAGVSNPSASTPVIIDLIAPTVASSPFEFLTALRINYTFSEAVYNASSSNFTLVRTPSLTPLSFGFAGVVGNTASLDLDPATFPDTRFSSSIIPAGIIDAAGNVLSNAATTNSFFLRGDLNRSQTVDFTDLLTFSQNYGRTDANWSQGDFTYDGTVGFDDLLLLAQRYQTGLLNSTTSPRASKFSRTAIRADVLA